MKAEAAQVPSRAPGQGSAGEAQAAYALYRAAVRAAAPQADTAALDILARRAQGGDTAAREALYLILTPWLAALATPAYRYARHLPAAYLQPADLQQERFLAFCALLASWQPARAPFTVYLGQVLPHRLAHVVRRARRPREIALPDLLDVDMESTPDPTPGLAEAVEAAAGTAPDPAELVAAADLRARVLAGLEPRAARLVTLHILEGRPMAEVAPILGLSVRQGWRLRTAALATLRARLGAQGYGLDTAP